jgi:hypothetical protein
MPSIEDILYNPKLTPYSPEVDEALSPSISTLKTLWMAPETVEDSNIPAKKWLEDRNENLRKTLIPYTGNLNIRERGEIANWYETHISKDTRLRGEWMGSLPTAHATTLFIAYHLSKKSKDKQELYLEKAWKLQEAGTLSLLEEVDVDKECLGRLEEQMFEKSSRAGPAGNYQWGLDAGDHQGAWDPYDGAPGEWNHGDRSGSEAELEVRQN